MADRMSNIAGLFKEGKTRTILLTTLIILFVAIIVGFFTMRGRVKGVEAQAGIAGAPGGIQSVPFEAPNEEYARLQEQQNSQQAKQAEQAGGSAIPTIIRSGKDTAPPPGAEAGVGFTALSREQTETGTFSAKEFSANSEKSAACPVCPIETTSAQGMPIYDKNGRLIGYAGTDGKVRDVNNSVIGALGTDGLLRDANGNIIGQGSFAMTGTPVYDDKGNLIGYVGPDGKIHDAMGRVIGTLGPDGRLRDESGKIIGRIGTPVYDANGKLIGFAGPDGKIRDANGNIVGTVGPDGVARDMSGNIIGKAGPISPGTPIYDSNGNIIGYVGPDGKVRDANGNEVGIIGVDGQVRDAQGNIIGSVVKPEVIQKAPQQIQPEAQQGSISPEAQSTPETATASYERQQEILKDQRLSQQMQQKQQAMSAQANQLLAAWSSPNQQYVLGQTNEKAATQESGGEEAGSIGGQAGASQGGTKVSSGPVFIKAGTVYYAVINTEINSDEPGPIMATITNGDYSGGKLLGTLTTQGQAVLVTFNTLTLPQFSKSIAINGVAIDQNTARTGLSTETNNHYFLRFGSLFAASFAQGYAQALTTAGSATSTNGLTTTTSTPQLSGPQQFYVALGNVGTQFGNQMNNIYNTPPTVHVASGTAIGVLFMGDVPMPVS
jgi:type IV secretory pathway VirB10-like protein